MRVIILLFLLFSISFTQTRVQSGEISLDDVQGHVYCIEEKMNGSRNVIICMYFRKDSILMYKTYYNPTEGRNDPIYKRYFKGKVYDKHYRHDDEDNLVTLDFMWDYKEYRDAEWNIPIYGNSIYANWFIYKFKGKKLLMGKREETDKDGVYWEFVTDEEN